MSTTKFWLRRLIRNRTGTGAALALALACSAPSVFGVLRSPARIQSKATVRTDKAGYLAGEPIKISGEGFQPFESVSLLVSHSGGAAEAGAGHERFFVTADNNGSFTANWSVNASDHGAQHSRQAAAPKQQQSQPKTL